MSRRAPIAWLCLVVSTAVPITASAVPVTIAGTVITPVDPGYLAITGVLGSSSSHLVAFNLEGLPFDPTAFAIIDDGIPLAGAASALLYSGIDADSVGGLSALDGMPAYATGIAGFVPGQRISAAEGVVAADNDPFIAAAGFTNKTPAAPGGTGGAGFLYGTSDDALGAPNALSAFFGGLNPEGGWVSIGSGGTLSLLFSEPIRKDGNIAGTIYDLVVFDQTGAGDSGLFQVDIEPIPVAEPGTLALVGAGLVALRLTRRRKAA